MYECMNAGLTIFEKLEKYSDADAAICLLTCDDMGKEKNEKRFKGRARQNAFFAYMMRLLFVLII